MNSNDIKPWELISRFVEIKSRWVTVIGENLRDNKGQQLEYWRVEKADSLVVLVEQNGKLLLPKPQYRPGVQAATLDFCGGRVDSTAGLAEQAQKIARRELQLSEEVIFAEVTPINATPLNINSSFENQRLFGYVVKLADSVSVADAALGGTYDLTDNGVQQLLGDLPCLQCRALLLEWQHKLHIPYEQVAS